MTTEDALMRAILDNPRDDTPRLAYADHLDETATPKRTARAEFIRCQTRASDSDAARRRANKLLELWGQGWVPKFARAGGHGRVWSIFGGRVVAATTSDTFGACFDFTRGFVSEVAISSGPVLDVERALAYAAGCLAWNPVRVIEFEVTGRDPEIVIEVRHTKRGFYSTVAERVGKDVPTRWILKPYRSRRECVERTLDKFGQVLANAEFTPSPIPF